MNKPVLLLLPGLLCDGANWAPQCRALADLADCRVAAYGALDSIEAMATHVLSTAPPGAFSLAGHSMGGRVALEVLRRAPERVERLALLDTGFQALPEGAAGEQERAARLDLLSLARAFGMRAMGEPWARGMVHPACVGTPVFETILEMIARSTPQIFEAQIRALLGRPDASELLPQIVCPTLLLCGREDRWSPPERHQSMHAMMPTSRLQIVEASGHMTTLEQPQAVSQGLAAWMGASLIETGSVAQGPA
ncbi:alpha/beta hydrolase [Ideonella azotifigens]|uniref:Alpha/beta hydrolase n=1 Tax=Ideonella azotifigens TaxID=513160 RepID=A0ABP3V2V7_9BURK|nr:alpha/beta hydrolase [Ideonella azotifigens]MCD2341167.1 alpha/beta hydrolase [Ideonella azotifigens]